MKPFFLLLYLTIGFILVCFSIIKISGTRADMVDGVTGDKIKQIKPGQSLEQVILTLGRPYQIRGSVGMHNIKCVNSRPMLKTIIYNDTDIREIVDSFYAITNYCCEGNKEDMQLKAVTLDYTRPVILTEHYPMLWVHLDSSFAVCNVFAKQYDGLLGYGRDPCIYSISWELDTTTMIMTDKIELFIDEAKFNNCFK